MVKGWYLGREFWLIVTPKFRETITFPLNDQFGLPKFEMVPRNVNCAGKHIPRPALTNAA